MKKFIFYFVAGGFILGILFSSYFKISREIILLCFILSFCVLAFLSGRYFFEKEKERSHIPILICIGSIFFLSGILRFNISENFFENSPLNFFEDKKISAIGVVSDEPARKDGEETFRVKVYAVSFGDKIEKITPTYILAKSPFYKDISYGQKILISGKIQKIKNIDSGNGKQFDYVSYLKKDGVAYQIVYPDIQVLGGFEGNKIVEYAFFIKNWFIENIVRNLGEPDASLVSGMTIAGKGALDKNLNQDFIKAGIIHIVVLSGYNIAIVIAALLSIFSFARRKIKMLAVICGVFLFVIMSGGAAPVVRAAIMATAIVFVKFSGRKSSAGRLLLLTAFVMLFFNPYILSFDTSFQLSFLATFAVIYVAPILKQKLLWISEKYKIREIVSETLGTQLFLLPFLVYKMGMVSLVALPVNILVLPFVSPIMLFGFFVGIFGNIFYLALPFAFISHILITIILFVVKVFVSIPFAYISIPSISAYFVFFIYAIFLIYLYRLKYFLQEV